MAWIEIHQGLVHHHKVMRLRAAMGWNLSETLGFLVRFWLWALDSAQNGCVDGFTWPGVAEEVLGLRKDHSAKAFDAMVSVGLLDELPDGKHQIHDWADYAGRILESRAAKRERDREFQSLRRRQRVVNESLTTSSASRCPTNPTNPTNQQTKEDCAEIAKGVSPPSPAVLTFECDGPVRSWELSVAKAREYAETFPSLDVMAEFRKALQWIRDNPSKRKTARGMPSFLTAWLSRSQNRPAGQFGGVQKAGRSTGASGLTPEEIARYGQWREAKADDSDQSVDPAAE